MCSEIKSCINPVYESVQINTNQVEQMPSRAYLNMLALISDGHNRKLSLICWILQKTEPDVSSLTSFPLPLFGVQSLSQAAITATE